MTTLAAWVAVDQRSPASLYLVADSRLTWAPTTAHWDYGRKLFASHRFPDVIGYQGDVLFPTQVLGQFFESIDRGVTGQGVTEPQLRLDLLVSAIESAARGYPPAIDRRFSIIYGSRQGEFMNSSFALMKVDFERGHPAGSTTYKIPQTSGLVEVIGSGADNFRDTYIQWQARDAGGTSRAVYSAFAEHLRLGGDPRSGGPPQLVGIVRKGPAKTFGVIWNGKRFFGGMEIDNSTDETPVRWHNELFEVCNPNTLKMVEGAQMQPLPRSHGKDLESLRKQSRRLP